jgi:hypothetical protein
LVQMGPSAPGTIPNEPQPELALRWEYPRLQHIEEQANAAQERVDGYRDQKLSALFVESGWSQEHIAEFLSKKWGKPIEHSWVSRRMRFGRFISFFVSSGHKDSLQAPLNLTERAFRKFWDGTESAGDFRGHSPRLYRSCRVFRHAGHRARHSGKKSCAATLSAVVAFTLL